MEAETDVGEGAEKDIAESPTAEPEHPEEET